MDTKTLHRLKKQLKNRQRLLDVAQQVPDLQVAGARKVFGGNPDRVCSVLTGFLLMCCQLLSETGAFI